MSRKPDGLIDLSNANYDFSKDNKSFQERLRKEFLCAVSQSQAAPLSDDEIADLNAAGDRGLMFDT